MIKRIWSDDLGKAIRGLDVLVTNIPIRAKTSTKKIAQEILWMSQNVSPMVPVKTGDLKSTGRVEPTSLGHAVKYGGTAKSGSFVHYAEHVHDDLRPKNWTTPGTGAKYVESHFHRKSREAASEIGNDMQRFIWSIFGRK